MWPPYSINPMHAIMITAMHGLTSAGQGPLEDDVLGQGGNDLLEHIPPAGVAHDDNLRDLLHMSKGLQTVSGDGLPLQIEVLLGDAGTHALAHTTGQQDH